MELLEITQSTRLTEEGLYIEYKPLNQEIEDKSIFCITVPINGTIKNTIEEHKELALNEIYQSINILFPGMYTIG